MLNSITASLQYNNPYRAYGTQANQAAAARSVVAIPSAQPETPVNAVAPVRPVRAVQSSPLDQNSLLWRWENDPAAMAVRGRIQYGGPGWQTAQAATPQALQGGQVPQVDPASQAAQAMGPGQAAPLTGAGGEELEDGVQGAQNAAEEGECQTCKERKYQDGSDDPGVSFKTAAHIDPGQAAAVVRGHEQEHVMREQAKAAREDRKVVSQSVTLHTEICPECGKAYISGGTTRTVTKAAQKAEEPAQKEDQQQGMETGGENAA